MVVPPEFRFVITGNRRFSGSYYVIATVRRPFHSRRSLKRTTLRILVTLCAGEQSDT